MLCSNFMTAAWAALILPISVILCPYLQPCTIQQNHKKIPLGACRDEHPLLHTSQDKRPSPASRVRQFIIGRGAGKSMLFVKQALHLLAGTSLLYLIRCAHTSAMCSQH